MKLLKYTLKTDWETRAFILGIILAILGLLFTWLLSLALYSYVKIILGIGFILCVGCVVFFSLFTKKTVDVQRLKQILIRMVKIYGTKDYKDVLLEKINEKLARPIYKEIKSFFISWSSEFQTFNMLNMAYLLILRRLADHGCNAVVCKRVSLSTSVEPKSFLNRIMKRIGLHAEFKEIYDKNYKIIEDLISYMDRFLDEEKTYVERVTKAFNLYDHSNLTAFIRHYTFILSLPKVVREKKNTFYILLESSSFRYLTGFLIEEKCDSFLAIYLTFKVPSREHWLKLGYKEKEEILETINKWKNEPEEIILILFELIFIPLCVYYGDFKKFVDTCKEIKYESEDKAFTVTFSEKPHFWITSPLFKDKNVEERNEEIKNIKVNLEKMKEITVDLWRHLVELLMN